MASTRRRVRNTRWRVQRGDPDGVQLVSTEAEDGGEYGGEARVILNPVENRKSSFKELNPNS